MKDLLLKALELPKAERYRLAFLIAESIGYVLAKNGLSPGCNGHENEHLSEALRLIRKHMQPSDTVGKMFLRVAKALEAEQFTQFGEVCDGCGNVLICRNCGKFRSGEAQEDRRQPRELIDREPDHGQYLPPRT